MFTIIQYLLIFIFYFAHGWFGTESSTYNKVKAKQHILSNRATRIRIQEMLERESRMRQAAGPAA